jgi:hypothetical protein
VRREISQKSLSTDKFKNLRIIKPSMIADKRFSGDNSIQTSPFNRNSVDLQTNSSAVQSTKNANKDELRKGDIDYWNEDDLYNLSQENSNENEIHEIVQLNNDDSNDNFINEEVDMEKYIQCQLPQHSKGASSLYSQNTHDLNKLLYAHRREASNGVSSSNKCSEMLQSYQASFLEQFRSLRVSQDVLPGNFSPSPCYFYAQETPKEIDQLDFTEGNAKNRIEFPTDKSLEDEEEG